MLIIAQDKSKRVNSNDHSSVAACCEGFERFVEVDGETMGYYKTLGRAKVVASLIACAHSNGDPTFCMPEE